METALSTIDNPYSPFTQYEDWEAYDLMKGYNTNSYLARIAKTSDSLTDEENEAEIDRAMKEIVELNVLGVHRIVTQEDFKNSK